MYTYAWYHWIAFFYFYCFFGWVFESTYVSLKKRHFVNRGFLRLPMLPLYGTGAVMMLWVSLPVKNNIVLVYLAGFIAATLLEYVTGYVMERLFKMKYWDYSNQKFNLHGYICLSSSIAWGFLTILMTEFIHKPVERFVLSMNPILEAALIGVISAFFLVDAVQSVREAIDLGRALEAMTKMKAELDDLQVQMALLKAETSQKVSELKENTAQIVSGLRVDTAQRVSELKVDTAQRMSELKVDTAQKIAGWKEQHEDTARKVAGFKSETEAALISRLEQLTERRHKLTHHMSFYRKGILRGNPTASSRKFAEALKELRDSIDAKR